MSPTDPTKRIPNSLTTTTTFIGPYSLTDVAVVLIPGVLIVLVMQLFVPIDMTVAGVVVHQFTIPLAVISMVAGATFVYLTPSYTTSLNWLEMFLRFRRRPKRHRSDSAAVHTEVAEVHADRRLLERTDGALVGAVQVSTPTMALATTDEWRRKANAFRNFLNTSVDFPIQIYSTTQEFPVSEYLSQYESRLHDPDVKANPQLAALIEHYIEWFGLDLEQRGVTIRDHYVVVSLHRDEIQFGQESLTNKLAQLPVLGVFMKAWAAPRHATEQDALFEAVESRLVQVERGLRSIEGCSTTRVDSTALLNLVSSYWAGREVDYSDAASVANRRPILGGRK